MKIISKIIICVFILLISTRVLATPIEVNNESMGYKTIIKDDYFLKPMNNYPPFNSFWVVNKQVDFIFNAPAAGCYQFDYVVKNVYTGADSVNTSVWRDCVQGVNYFQNIISVASGICNLATDQVINFPSLVIIYNITKIS